MKFTEIAARLREMADYLETEATQRDYDFPDKTVVPFIADAFNDDNFRNTKKQKDPHIGATIMNIHFPWDPADAKSDATNIPFEICPAGKHKMSGSNILLTKKGKRRCLACWSESRRARPKIRLCRSKRHTLTNLNLIVSKDGKRQCLDCRWDRNLDFTEAYNRSKVNGITTASGSQLLEWSEKAQKTVKIAEAAKDATVLLAQRQDLRLFRAVRRLQQAQKRFEKIVHIAQEICEAWKLKANVEGEF